MPELPDVELYLHALRPRVVGQTLAAVRVRSPSLLRTYDPPISEAHGRRVPGVRRVGKRIVFELDGGLLLSLHLMIAGRLKWAKPGAAIPGRVGLAALDFDRGTLLIIEAARRKRAQLHLLRGEAALGELDRGGMEPLDATREEFEEALRRENHTLKRALTDPRFFSGIGNAHSDEILHRARLSPVKRTRQLDEGEIRRLYEATRSWLTEHTERLRAAVGEGFPDKVTAFHPAMNVHGRHGEPCPRCGSPIQRIVYADNETNYCPVCQTGGKLLRDRALSRLLKEDWPRTLEELEET
jgi:formamidopyrimidine-DNA glycosylase